MLFDKGNFRTVPYTFKIAIFEYLIVYRTAYYKPQAINYCSLKESLLLYPYIWSITSFSEFRNIHVNTEMRNYDPSKQQSIQ